jgi:hypothetical protein
MIGKRWFIGLLMGSSLAFGFAFFGSKNAASACSGKVHTGIGICPSSFCDIRDFGQCESACRTVRLPPPCFSSVCQCSGDNGCALRSC